MSEINIKGKWKVKGKKVSKALSPLIGCVYSGVLKFSGDPVVGILVEIYLTNDEAVLQTKQGCRVSADLLSLKSIVNE